MAFHTYFNLRVRVPSPLIITRTRTTTAVISIRIGRVNLTLLVSPCVSIDELGGCSSLAVLLAGERS
jgi:hypothetical protein